MRQKKKKENNGVLKYFKRIKLRTENNAPENIKDEEK